MSGRSISDPTARIGTLLRFLTGALFDGLFERKTERGGVDPLIHSGGGYRTPAIGKRHVGLISVGSGSILDIDFVVVGRAVLPVLRLDVPFLTPHNR